MPCRYLLDTNICIYIRQRRSQALQDRFEGLTAGEAAISIITYGELHFGAEKSAEPELARQKLRNLVTALPVLPLPVEAGAHYGAVRAFLERRGEPIGGNDLWIAAHALAAQLILVTNNEREFRRVPHLNVENWSAPGA
jgi:tRNA(fMet)-specific endonuclease VapC